ncbi:hypothetical protein [Pontibacillus litoralis]|uniref:Uncharacterized protein n=1 Tax=Pontibacillus litoralis JSM 072002 TaxID=1385512 RepID=A0A0A5FZ66_9BACI|nr:hypothetical protein [Pontibacillus litoralis]KGX84133.1 hypothetical protein N784_14580 [Pontibacillus litoralis JSM 072002]
MKEEKRRYVDFEQSKNFFVGALARTLFQLDLSQEEKEIFTNMYEKQLLDNDVVLTLYEIESRELGGITNE